MPKCFIYSVRGYRDGRFWDSDGDHTNVMRTRSGRTISTLPCLPPGITVTKPTRSRESQQKIQQDFYKQFNRKVVHYRDISYVSILTRCRLKARQVPVHLLGNPNNTIQWIEDSPFSYDQSRWSFDLQGRFADLENTLSAKELSPTDYGEFVGLKKVCISSKDNIFHSENDIAEKQDLLFDTENTQNCIAELRNGSGSEGHPDENEESQNGDVSEDKNSSTSSCSSDSPTDTSAMSHDLESLFDLQEKDTSCIEFSEESTPVNQEETPEIEDEKSHQTKLRSHCKAKDFKLRVCLRPKKSKSPKNPTAETDTMKPNGSSSSGSLSGNLELVSSARIVLPQAVKPLPVLTSLKQTQVNFPSLSGIQATGAVLMPQVTKASVQAGIFNFLPHQNQPFQIIAAAPQPTVIPVMIKGHPNANTKSNLLPSCLVGNSMSLKMPAAPAMESQTRQLAPQKITTNQRKFTSNSMNEAIKMLYVNNVLKDMAAMKGQSTNVEKTVTNNNTPIIQDRSMTNSPCGSQTSQSSMDSTISDIYALDSDDSSIDSSEAFEKLSCEVHGVLSDSEGNQLHRCLVCSRIFTVLTAFKSHVRTHIRQANKCKICGKVFSRSWLLKGHMRVHTGEKPYKCAHPDCDKAFADKSNLRAHRQTHESDNKPFVCSACHRSFAQKRYLHKHQHEVCFP